MCSSQGLVISFLRGKIYYPIIIYTRNYISFLSKSLLLALWVSYIIGLDKGGYPVNIFLISPQKHMLWYSLEAPRRGASNEYPQHMFSWRNKKNINTFGLKKAP